MEELNHKELNHIKEEIKEKLGSGKLLAEYEETLTKSILEEYEDICGEDGLETFEEVTLQRLFACYRPYYHNLEKRAEDIIDKAGDCKREEIDDFLEDCVKVVEYTNREHVRLEFKRRYKDESRGRTYLKYTDPDMYYLLRKFNLMDELIPIPTKK